MSMMKFPAPEKKKPKLAFSANISGAMGRRQEKEVSKIERGGEERESKRDGNRKDISKRLVSTRISYFQRRHFHTTGDGDAPTTEDESSIEGSEVECKHVPGRKKE